MGVNAMAHCCAENFPGYLECKSSYIDNSPPHEWDIPRYMLLEQGILEKLKDIVKKYQVN